VGIKRAYPYAEKSRESSAKVFLGSLFFGRYSLSEKGVVGMVNGLNGGSIKISGTTREYRVRHYARQQREWSKALKQVAKQQAKVMTLREVVDKGLSIDDNAKVVDNFGNEYRNEQGCVVYIYNKK
jgi:hypothetical protein